MSVYKHNLVLFGGGAHYNKNVKLRLTMNDVNLFDTCKLTL